MASFNTRTVHCFMKRRWRVTTASGRFGQNVTGGRFGGSTPGTGRDSFLNPDGRLLFSRLFDVFMSLCHFVTLPLLCVCPCSPCVHMRTVAQICCIFVVGYYWRAGKLVPDKRYVKPDTSRVGADDPMLGLLNMWDTEGRRFGNPMGKNEGLRRRVTDSLPIRPATTSNASNRSSATKQMSRGFMTSRAKTKNILALRASLPVRPHTTQDRTRGLTPPNKLIDSYTGTACKQQRMYKIQYARADTDGRMSNTSVYNTLKKLAVPDGAPTMDIIGYAL